MANNQFLKSLIQGRFKYTQILVCNVAGVVPTITDITAGQLAFNTTDQLLYGSNGTGIFILSELFDFTFLVQNTYLQANYSNNTVLAAGFIANVTGNAAAIPVGNNSNRPSPASNGYFRYNTDATSLEAFINGSWVYIDYAGGANTQVQFNDSNYLNASAAFTFNKATNTVTVSNTINSLIYFSGNSTVNLSANSTQLTYANSTVSANLSIGLLVIGNAQINSTTLLMGANVSLNTTSLMIGNATANLFANSIILSYSNSLGIANLQPLALTIGNSIVNNIAVSVGGTGNMVINTTALMAGGNVTLNMSSLSIGNSTANLLANSILLTLANSSGTANLQPTQLVIGISTVNSTVISVGANVFANSTDLVAPDAIINSYDIGDVLAPMSLHALCGGI